MKYLFIITFSLLSFFSQAQIGGGNEDIMASAYIGPDTAVFEPSPVTLNRGRGGKEPEKENTTSEPEDSTAISLVRKDSVKFTTISAELDSLYHNPKVARIMADSVYWTSVQPCFAIFDSMNVNPYNVDGSKIADTTVLGLFDTLNTKGWSMPLKRPDGCCHVNSDFGQRHWRWHYGTDLDLEIGDSVLAAFDGVVRISKMDWGGYGKYVMIRHHNGLETLYGHLSRKDVHVGDTVKAGDLLGLGGNTGRSTGPHLHFEVRYKGNAIDPKEIYDFESYNIKTAEFAVVPAHFDYIREQNKRIFHRIRSGDTLSGISSRYHVSMNKICRLNGINRRTILRIGKVLRVR